MTRIVALDREAHRSLTVDPGASAAYGDAQRFVQVIVGEFPHLVVSCPILLAKDAGTGQFYCGALLGFDEGENLLLEDWAAGRSHRPLSLQRAPFHASGPDIAIDLDDPRVGAPHGTPLFEENGRPTRYLSSIVRAFHDLAAGSERTRAFLARLSQLQLIEPLDVEVELDDGRTRRCVGLYTIDQEALARLPDGELVELFRRGHLRLIDLMIASVKQLGELARKKNARLLAATEHLAGARAAVR